jgi:hypothetical protein
MLPSGNEEGARRQAPSLSQASQEEAVSPDLRVRRTVAFRRDGYILLARELPRAPPFGVDSSPEHG